MDTAKLTAAHTPGPWHASNVRTTGPFPGCDIGAADCSNVAMVHYDTISHEDAAETLANARLIAAAPELLEALRDATTEISELRDWIDRHVPAQLIASEDWGKLHKPLVTKAVLRNARAAIARATGTED